MSVNYLNLFGKWLTVIGGVASFVLVGQLVNLHNEEAQNALADASQVSNSQLQCLNNILNTGESGCHSNQGLDQTSITQILLVAGLFILFIGVVLWVTSKGKRQELAESSDMNPIVRVAQPAGATTMENRYCSQCGTQLTIDARFCPACGSKRTV